MTATDDRSEDVLAGGRMTIWEHLAELRSRLIRSAIAVAVGMVVGWVAYPYVVTFLVEPYNRVAAEMNVNTGLYSTELLDPFLIRIQTSVYLGIGLAMPVLLWQLWRFVTPGLYPHEKKYAIPFVASALLLFFFGAALAYWTLPAAIQFLISVAGFDVTFIPSIDGYLKLNLFMMLAFGAGFEFPVLLVALQLVGVLSPRKLLGWWRYAIVIIVVFAAVITPSGDPISMMALAVPMVVFYFMAIGIGAIIARRQRRGVRGDDVIT